MIIALCTPIVSPGIATQTTAVSQAKTYKSKTVKAVRKKFNKLKYGIKYSKAKKILGGKPTEIKDLETTLDGSSTMGKYIWYFDCSTKTKLITVQSDSLNKMEYILF